MKKIEIEIPEGKKAEWVNGVLTLIDESKIYYEFKVGDKAFLKRDEVFTQGTGVSLIGAGTEVEIVKVFGITEKIYEIKYKNSTSVVYGGDLDKIEFKFNIGDRVTLVDRPLAVFTIVDQIIKDGKLYYGVEGRPNYLPYEESELMPYGNKIVKHKFNVNDKVRLTDVPDSLTYTVKGIRFQDGGYIYTLDNGTTKICVAENLIELISEEVTDSKVEFKYNVGDIVSLSIPPYGTYEIKGVAENVPTPHYKLSDEGNVYYQEDVLTIVQDITERIKTFDDAVKWCVENGKREMLRTYSLIFNGLMNPPFEITEDVDDIIAYLKLRIITAALNEGWEPKFTEDEERCHIIYDVEDDSYDFGYSLKWETAPNKLIFKSEKLAAYAAKQFFDIYADFCGCKKYDKQ